MVVRTATKHVLDYQFTDTTFLSNRFSFKQIEDPSILLSIHIFFVSVFLLCVCFRVCLSTQNQNLIDTQ